MGDAIRRKIFNETKIVEFDFSAVELVVGKANKDSFKDRAVPECCRILIRSIVGAKFPNGMDRKSGKYWAAWLEIMDDDNPPDVAEMPYGQFEFMKKIVVDESLSLDFRLIQWREALADYMESVVPKEVATNEERS